MVIAFAALEYHLAANGQRINSQATSLDTAGQLLRQHGISYPAAYEVAGTTNAHLAGPGDSVPELDDDAGRRTKTLAGRMKAAGWPYVGTTAILHAHLAEPVGAGAELVRASGRSGDRPGRARGPRRARRSYAAH